MFEGFVNLEATLTFDYQSRDSSNVPTADDGTPSYRIYGASATPLATGNLAAFDSGNLTGVYRGSLAIAGASGFERGKKYSIRIGGTVSSAARGELRTFIVT